MYLSHNDSRSQADDDDEGWSSLFPLLLEHVRLLFQCGIFLEQLAQVFSPILQTEKAKVCQLKPNSFQFIVTNFFCFIALDFLSKRMWG